MRKIIIFTIIFIMANITMVSQISNKEYNLLNMDKSETIQLGIDLTNYDNEYYKYSSTKHKENNIVITYSLDKDKSKVFDKKNYNKLTFTASVDTDLNKFKDGYIDDDSLLYTLSNIKGNKDIILNFWEKYILNNIDGDKYQITEGEKYWEITKK